MALYKNIEILNHDVTDVYQVKQVIDDLQANNYEVYEVIKEMYIGIYDRKIYYNTILHSDNNKTFILNN